jgi:ADP-ribose pyrophosphatase
MYKKVSSKIVFKHPRITLVEDQVELPSGQQADYLWFDGFHGAVTIIARDEAGRILVEREYSYLPNHPLYQFPGGGISAGELPEEAANRELLEEVGLHAHHLIPLGSYYLDHRRTTALMHIFLGEELTMHERTSHDIYEVDIQTMWLAETEIDNLIASGEIVNSAMLSTWAVYKNRRQEQ